MLRATLKSFGMPLLLQQTQLYNNLDKPTYSYPFAKLWSEENARIAKWLKDRNRITKALTAKDYEELFDMKFMANTYEAQLENSDSSAIDSGELGRNVRQPSLPVLCERQYAQGASTMAGTRRPDPPGVCGKDVQT